MLEKFFKHHIDMPVEAAAIVITEAYRASGWAERVRGLTQAQQIYTVSLGLSWARRNPPRDPPRNPPDAA